MRRFFVRRFWGAFLLKIDSKNSKNDKNDRVDFGIRAVAAVKFHFFKIKLFDFPKRGPGCC